MWKKLIYNILFGFFILLFLVPFIWLILAAFKTRIDALSDVPQFFFRPTLDHFFTAFGEKGFGRQVNNSFWIASISTIIALLIGIPAAYIFSRFEFRFKNDLFFFILSTRMAPAIASIVPIFVIYAQIQLVNSYIGIISIHTMMNLSFVIWIMKSFFDEIPKEIDDSSLIDGANHFGTFFKIILPLAKIGIFVTFFFCFILSWNEFLFSSILSGYETQTITVAIQGLITPHGTFWGQVAAVAIVGTIPTLVVVFVLQKFLIRAFTFGIKK